jgi:hypothetical protein
MQALKDYYLWVILGVVFVGLVVFELVYVRGVRSSTEQAHQEVVDTLKEGRGLSGTLGGVPTRADVAAAHAHLEAIRAERETILRIWRSFTGGLNSYMSNGARENGTVVDPATGEPIRWDLFGFRVRDLYEEMFAAARYAYGTAIRERMAESYAEERLLTVAGISETAARAWGEARARDEALWWSVKFASPRGLVPFEQFQTFTEEQKHLGWQQWRIFLITADILGRVVPAAMAEIERPVVGWARNEAGRLDPAAGTEVHRVPTWRFVEAFNGITVRGPEPGTAVLPGPDIEEGSPEFSEAIAQVGREDARFYDVFRVQVRLRAHPAVIQAFMREVLKSRQIWYVPGRVRIEPAPTVQPPRIPVGYAADGGETERDGRTGGFEAVPAARDFAAPAPGGGVPEAALPEGNLRKDDAFGYEAPVNAVLEYEVYRFRYTDTDNPSRRMFRENETF